MQKTLVFILLLFPVLLFFSCTPAKVKTPVAEGSKKVDSPEMKVGDKWFTMQNDWLNGTYTEHVSKVVSVQEYGNFKILLTVPEFNREIELSFDKNAVLKKAMDKMVKEEIPIEKLNRFMVQFPLWVGKKWDNEIIDDGGNRIRHYYKVKAYKKIKTVAGEFRAFKIHRNVVNENVAWNVLQTCWYAPDAKSYVMCETDSAKQLVLKKYFQGG